MTNKTAMVTICGRPNVGKSTLVNTLVGEKIAIVSSKPQTTRNRISAVVNRDDTQYIFLDTPGFHTPKTRLDQYMENVVRSSVADVDAVLMLAEPTAEATPKEEELMENIRKSGVPAILGINKIDKIPPDRLLPVMAAYGNRNIFQAIIPLSAKTGEGVDDLFRTLHEYAVESPALYPDDMITDQPERQICAELVREKLLCNLDKEVPHGIAVEISRFHEREDGLVEIEATIYCEKESHKGIVIGKHGAMLKKVGAEARQDMEEFLGTKVFLRTWVKVKENWRDSDVLLKNFGYTED